VHDAPVPHTYIANYVRPIGDETPEEVEARAEAPTRLLYTGTLSDGRGLGTMVDLAARIRRAGRPETIGLVGICRHPAQRARTEEQIRGEGLDGIVERVGWDTYVRPSSMPPYYRRADVGLALFEPHPNHADSIPTKFYEYLYYGLPLICSDLSRWRRFVERHECGVVVPPRTPEAVLDVLDHWQARPDRYRTHVNNAREAASQYRWDAMGECLVDRYRTLLDADAPPSPGPDGR
jgi:glycosyltransferase involved in cell wall biosynthesis